ncbi:MAG: hypothetical protein GF334_01215 [Candidatus Altiarchaeales archaeon]|nr:hypothetical protein [Candidatus Altiarchaeales archaeon]
MRRYGNKPGQASIEFLVSVSAILIIFIVAGFFVFEKVIQITDYKVNIQGKRLSKSFADNINSVTAAGDGYSQRMYLPNYLYAGREYELVFYENDPRIHLHGSSFSTGDDLFFSAPLSTDLIECNLRECFSG